MPSPSTPTPSTLPRHLAIEQCVLMDTFYIPGDGTSKACCARINGFAQDLIADLMDSSAEGATVEQCSGDGVNVGGDCYETTMGALEGAEDSFGQENMVAPFVEACETLMTITESPTIAPTGTPMPTPFVISPDDCGEFDWIRDEQCPPTNSTCDVPDSFFDKICSKPVDNGTRWDGNLVPQCIPCSRLNGYYMSGSSFVNISEYLDMGYIHDPTRACAAGYQCVAEDPYDALPDYDRDFSKTPGCCQKCLNGQSCPPMTVAATGYYFDNLCPDGFKCEVGEWPVPCEIGEMCYKGVQINCSMVVESVRGGGSALGAVEGVGDTVDNFNSNGMSVSTNSSEGKAVGFLDGAYCPGGANLEWCPGGFYCPSPDQMIECPVGYFCPPKTRFFEFKCNEATCGPGAMFNETQIKVQVMIAAIVVGMAMLLGITHSISEHYDRLDEQKRFEERRINNAEKDFLVQELMSLRIAKKLEEAKRMNGGGESQDEVGELKKTSSATMPKQRRTRKVTEIVMGAFTTTRRKPGKLSLLATVASASPNSSARGEGRGGGGSASSQINEDALAIAKKHMGSKLRDNDKDGEDEDEDEFPDLEAPEGTPSMWKTARKKTTRVSRRTTKVTPVLTDTNAITGKEEVKIDEADLLAMGVPTYDEIKEIFESIDKDGDGLITLPELRNTKLGKHLNEKELQKIMDGTLQENKAPIPPKASGVTGRGMVRRGSMSKMMGGMIPGLVSLGMSSASDDETDRGKLPSAGTGVLGALPSSLSSIKRESHSPTLQTFAEQHSPKHGEVRMPAASNATHALSDTNQQPERMLERRKSFVADLQSAFADPGAAISKATPSPSKVSKKGKHLAHSKGITFEEFSKQFFELMTAKVKDEGIISDPNIKGVELDFQDINLYVSVAGKEFQVLKNVCGVVKQKSMVALMGGSGAGKTSLLNTLCGRAFYATRISGTLKINGKEDKMENYQDIIGFVPQDDIVHGDLTVYENLLYSGLFRLPFDTPFEEIEDLADQILEELQMTHIRDSLVGTQDTRGISGGQKKRVNIGWELMARPKILFLDEPTSGLDAASSSVALSALKRLAKRGTTVVTVIHQPRYSIFEMFDNVLLLGKGGQVAYQGKPNNVVPYFNNLGFSLPFGENPADWMLDITSGTLKSSKKGGEEVADTFDARITFLYETWKKEESRLKQEAEPSVHNGERSLRDDLDETSPPGIYGQYMLYLERSYKQRSRKFKIICLDMLLIVGSAYLGASISGNYKPIQPDFEVLDISAAAIMNVTLPGAEKVEFPTPFLKSFEMTNEYAMITNLLFVILLTLSSLRSFGDDKLIFFREAGSGFNVTSFFLSQLTLDQVLFSVQALWAAIASYELRTSLVPLSSWIILYQLTAFFCSGWAYVFSLVIPRDNLVMFSALFVSVCGTLLSGSLTFLRYTDIYSSGFLSVFVGMLSSTRWFTEWMIVSEFRALPQQYGFTSEKLDYFRIAGYGMGDLDRARLQDGGGWYYNVVPMVAVGVGLRLVCYSLILTRSRKKMNRSSLGEVARSGVGGLLWAFVFGVLLLFIGFGAPAYVIHSYAKGINVLF